MSAVGAWWFLDGRQAVAPRCRACGRPQHYADIVCPSPKAADKRFMVAPAYVPPPAPRRLPVTAALVKEAA